MAKYNGVDEDDEIQIIFDSVLNATSIPKWVTFRVLTNEKAKVLIEAKKMSDLMITLSDVNIAIVINPKVFDQLEDEYKKLVIQECLTGISVDMENDKINIEKPDFTTYSSFLNIHGNEKIIRIKEVTKSIFDKIEEEEKQLKQQKSEKKAKKKSY